MILGSIGILNSKTGISPSFLILDLYPNAAVGYSLRKLRTDYSGNAIRVRRNIDNAEQDISFSGNDLDTNSMLNFVGANLWTYSEEWDNAVYIKTGLNTSGTPNYINVEIAPDTTLTADKIIESNISQGHLSSRQFLVTNGETYNVSVYLKHGGRDVTILSPLSNLVTYSVDVDLINGTLSNNTFLITPILENVGSGWYRLSYQVTATNTQTRNVITINLRNPTAPNPINYLGDGVSGVFVWGFQLSQTSTVKPYQKTVATAGGNGFITTWYDQSTNANNSTQATATNQAQIVLNGNLILDADTNKITTTWTSDRYSLTTDIDPNTKYLSVSAARRQTTSGVLIGLGVSGIIGGSNGQTPLVWIGNGTLRSYMFSLLIHNTITTADGYIITSEKNGSNLKTIYLNGVSQPTTASESPSLGANIDSFGQAGGNYTIGQYQEYIYWNSEQSANRTEIEDNINTYWNAY